MASPYLDRLRDVVRDYGDEQVLCVPRGAIFAGGAWQGLRTQGIGELLAVIERESEFRPRVDVEDDPSQQQIVPYCVVHQADGTYLLTRRLGLGSEQRLHDRYSLGVGGHVNPSDATTGDPVVGGLAREWTEEVVCRSPATARLVGAIKDESTPVSQVHLGLVFMVRPDHGMVTVREHQKLAGECLDVSALRARRAAMETWSQLVFDGLLSVPGGGGGRSHLTAALAPGAAEQSAPPGEL